MRKFIIIVSLFSALSLCAQEAAITEAKPKFGINFQAKLGYASLVRSNNVDLQGTVNAGDMLFYYKFSDLTSISTGIGLLEYRANGTTAGESYSLSQTYLRIPVYMNFSLSIFEDALSNKLQAYTGIGFYANTLLEEEIQTLNENITNENQGWNGGYAFQVGMKFGVSEGFNFGIGFETQSDFSAMKKKDTKRKLEGISTINFQLIYNF